MKGFRSLSDVLDDDEMRLTDREAAVLRGRYDHMANRCSDPVCASLGGKAGHRGRHRGSAQVGGHRGSAPTALKRPTTPGASSGARPRTSVGGGMDEITIRVPRAQLEQLRDLAIAEEGPQPDDVFSEAFDAWRAKALLVRKLNDALSGQ